MTSTAPPPSQQATAFDTSQLAGIGIKPLVSLMAHPRLALASFVLVLCAGIPFAWIKGQAHYVATSTVQIAPRYMKILKDDNELDFQSNSQYRQFVEHQARSVARFDIVQAALKSMGPLAKEVQAPNQSERRKVELLQERIMVNPLSDTYLMQISLEGRKPKGLAEFVNALVETYIARMQSEHMFGADERIRKLQSRELDLLSNINNKTAQRTGIALELGVANFQQGDGNPFDKLLLATRSALAEARNARMAAQARLQAFESHRETDITIRSINENLLSDPGLNSLKASLNNRRALLLTTVSGLTAQHPAYASAQVELQEIDAEIKKHTAILQKELTSSLLARYQMSLQQAQSYENGLQQVLQEQQSLSAQYAGKFNIALSLSNDIAQYNKEIESVRERLSFFSAETGALGFVRKVTPALQPELPFGPGRKKLLLLVLVAAVGCGLIAPIVRDLLERKIRTVNDAETVLKLPSLGWLIEKENMATQIFAQDQMRRLAGGLMREQNGYGTKIFSFCAVKPGAGNSQICLDLAKALTSLGYPCLVVEANAFRPDPRFQNHAQAGSAHDQVRPALGFAQALTEQARLQDCLLPADAHFPDRVAVGVSAGTALERLDRIPEVLDNWAQSYAFVLIDMPPLLLCADAEIMLNRLGKIVLVVEAGGINRGELSRAGRVLEKSAASSVGIIVNRVRVLDGGGYLKQVLVEFLTQRKFSQFAGPSNWRLLLSHFRMQVSHFVRRDQTK